MARRIVLALISVSCVAVPAARAQVAGQLHVGSGIGSAGNVWLRESRIAPSLQLYRAAGFLHVDASVLERGGALALDRSSLDAAIASPAFGPFRLSLGSAVTAWDERAWRAPEASATAAVSARLGSCGLFVGRVQDNRGTPGFMAGAWQGIGGALLSVSAGRRGTVERGIRFVDRMIPSWDSVWTDTSGWEHYQIDRPRRDTVATSRFRGVDELQAQFHWARGRWSVSALGAVQRGRALVDSGATQQTQHHGNVEVTARVSSRVSLVAHAGVTPAPPGTRAPVARFAMLGLSLSPPALLRRPLPPEVRPPVTAFSIERATGNGLRTVVLRVPGARTVEISGDFTSWKPVAMQEVSPNRWEATLAIAPGSHRVNVRINGDAWTAPPGVPSLEDEFNGRVGLIVVR